MANDWVRVEAKQSTMWDFHKDAELEGVYMGFRADVGPNKSNVYEVKIDDGLVSFWGSTVVDSRMKDIDVGSQIKVVYKGKTKNKAGSYSYNDYDIFQRPSEKMLQEEVEDF